MQKASAQKLSHVTVKKIPQEPMRLRNSGTGKASISRFYGIANASPTKVVANSGASKKASSDGLTEFGLESSNKEGDFASDVVRTYNGYVQNPYYICAQATRSAAWTGLSFEKAYGTGVFVHPYSGNAEGDRAGTIISVPTGSVANYYDVSDGYKGSSDSFAHFDLTSNGNQPAEITSHAEDKALSKQEDYGVRWTYNGGSADFAVKKNPGDKVINGWIYTIATSNDVDIDSSKLADKKCPYTRPIPKELQPSGLSCHVRWQLL